MISLNKLVEDVIEEITDKNTSSLVNLMWGKENVSEFKLADKLRVTVNQVRNMLYKLNSHSLVQFTRRKDKRKGWYIYYWTFDIKKSLDFLINLKQERINMLENRLRLKQVEDYFTCSNKCTTLKYASAMENEFRCPECGELLNKLDVKKQISSIKKQILLLNKEVEAGKEYLRQEIEKAEKRRIRMEKRSKNKIKHKKKANKKIKPKAKKKPKKGRK